MPGRANAAPPGRLPPAAAASLTLQLQLACIIRPPHLPPPCTAAAGGERQVTLLDYGAGNVRSVRNAIRKLGYTIKEVRGCPAWWLHLTKHSAAEACE